jgi:predicted lysophospholipase L1 biosynthesis ABC-type transport system permease subunit
LLQENELASQQQLAIQQQRVKEQMEKIDERMRRDREELKKFLSLLVLVLVMLSELAIHQHTKVNKHVKHLI